MRLLEAKREMLDMAEVLQQADEVKVLFCLSSFSRYYREANGSV